MEKLQRLEGVLRERPPGSLALVRVGTRLGAQYLAERLAADGFKARAMMGKGSAMSDVTRRQLLDAFRKGSDVDVLVSTAAMEEGIDVPRCALVVCFSVLRVLNRSTSLL